MDTKEILGMSLIATLFVGVPIWTSFALSRQLRRAHPSAKPFAWGYYNALMCFLAPLFVLASVHDNAPDLPRDTKLLLMGVLFCVYVPTGVMALQRNRLALTLMTLLSFNPLLWAVNFVYLSNRVHEFGISDEASESNSGRVQDFTSPIASVDMLRSKDGIVSMTVATDTAKVQSKTAASVAVIVLLLVYGSIVFNERPAKSVESNPSQYQKSSETRPNATGQDEMSEKLSKFIDLANKGDIDAQLELGRRYVRGDGVARNTDEAVKWYRLAALQGNAVAQYHLGFITYRLNYTEAAHWFRLAAEQGHAEAQGYLGTQYDLGYGVRRDNKEAIKWYRLGANQGDELSIHQLGTKYRYGKAVGINLVAAYALYNLAPPSGTTEEGKFYLEQLDDLESEMSKEQIETAQNLTREMAKPGNMLLALDSYINSHTIGIVKSKNRSFGGKSTLDCERELGARASNRELVSDCLLKAAGGS